MSKRGSTRKRPSVEVYGEPDRSILNVMSMVSPAELSSYSSQLSENKSGYTGGSFMSAGGIELDVRAFYETARHCLERIVDIESDQINGLSRSVAGLRRLISLGQATITVPSASWEFLAEIIEAEADRIDSFRQSRRVKSKLITLTVF